MNKEELIDQIIEHIALYYRFTCPDYPELGVYSKEYYQQILVRLFHDVKNPFSVIYSDVNKLSLANELHGKKAGDKALYTLLRLLTISMPKDSTTVRLGGDEFITILPNTKKENAQVKCNHVKSNVSFQKEHLYGTSFAISAEDSVPKKQDINNPSLSQPSLEDVVALAEHQVAIQKCKNRKLDSVCTQIVNDKSFYDLPVPKHLSEEQKQKWETLNMKINIAVDNHLRDIRPSSHDFQYKTTDIQNDAKPFLYATANSLKKQTKENSRNPSKSDVPFTEENSISDEDASNIHQLFSIERDKTISTDEKKKRLQDTLKCFSQDQLLHLDTSLANLSESLIHDKHSKLLTKSYYKLFLADQLLDSKQTYQATYFSMSGIRPNNTAYGHSVTDNKMSRTSTLLINYINKKREFNNTPFSFDKKDCFLIDQGGGNFIFLSPSSQALTQKEVKEMVDKINSHHRDNIDEKENTEDISTLAIAATIKNHVNRWTIPLFINSFDPSSKNPLHFARSVYQTLINRQKNPRLNSINVPFDQLNNKLFVQFARKLKEVCNTQKDSLKRESIKGKVNQDTLEVLMQPCVDFFCQEIEDSDTIPLQQHFISNVITALAQHEAFANKVMRETAKIREKETHIIKRNEKSETLYNENERE